MKFEIDDKTGMITYPTGVFIGGNKLYAKKDGKIYTYDNQDIRSKPEITNELPTNTETLQQISQAVKKTREKIKLEEKK